MKMKKLLITGIIISSVCLLGGCGDSGSAASGRGTVADNGNTNTNTNQIAEENDSSTNTIDSDDSNKVQDVEEEEETQKEAVALSYGELGSTEFVEITFDRIYTADEVKPEKPEGVYSYKPDKEDETYIVLKGTIKNVGTEEFEFTDNCYAKLIVDDKYNYDAYACADEGGDLSYIYAYLDPFKSETFYIIASVPDELIGQYQKVYFEYGFTENFKDSFLSREECDYIFSITAAK